MRNGSYSPNVLYAVVFCIGYVAGCPASGLASEDILERVIAGIKRNNSQIHTLKLTIEQVIISPSVERRETRTVELNGGTATFTVAPVSVSRSEITLKAEDIRSDRISRVGDDWSLTGITIRNNNVWTFYHPESKWAQIKPPSHLGAMFPIDPRQFGALDQRHDLLKQLSNLKVVEVLPVDTSRRDGIIRMLTEIKDGFARSHRRIYEFDASKNYLPTMVVSLRHDATIANVLEIDYQEVIPGAAWFFRGLTRKFFKDANVREVTANGWSQQTIMRTVGKVRVNEDVSEDLFNFKFPEGTRVVNQVGH